MSRRERWGEEGDSQGRGVAGEESGEGEEAKAKAIAKEREAPAKIEVGGRAQRRRGPGER